MRCLAYGVPALRVSKKEHFFTDTENRVFWGTVGSNLQVMQMKHDGEFLGWLSSLMKLLKP